ncbi:MAG: hypothetical protein IJ325_12140 [Clostridia bacterium]|nr:hypothetical protein [Clostridia bacterium]
METPTLPVIFPDYKKEDLFSVGLPLSKTEITQENVLSLIISTVTYIAYVEIQTTVIRNAMKTGLANLAYTISKDTYTALREGDFEKYVVKLTGESAYRTKLENTYEAMPARSGTFGTTTSMTDRWKCTATTSAPA